METKATGSVLELRRWTDAIDAHLTAPDDAGYRADATDALEEMKARLMELDPPKTWECVPCNRQYSDAEKGLGIKCWQGHMLTPIQTPNAGGQRP